MSLALLAPHLGRGQKPVGAKSDVLRAQTFDSLWKIMDDNYAFFRLRGVNWKEQSEKLRPRLKNLTNDADLFLLLSEMIDPLDDGHTSLLGEGKKFNSAPFESWVKRKGTYQKTILTQYLKVPESIADGNIVFGWLTELIGYIEIQSMDGYDPNLIDVAIAKLKNCKGLVLDVRFNGGGEDAHSMTIASRFADQRRLAYSKETYYKGKTSKWLDVYCAPAGESFKGPVVLLTGRMTCSAAEMFVMGMSGFPQVQVIGDVTQGIHSDILQKTLPNGWKLNLSNQIYHWTDGKVYEKIGMPPDKRFEFDSNAFDSGRDTTLEFAMKLLSK